jgi:hypothetical protein
VERLDAVEAKIRRIEFLREKARADLQLLFERSMASMVAQLASRPTWPLGELVEVVGGGTPPRSIPAFWDGHIPWITPKDMKALIAKAPLSAEFLWAWLIANERSLFARVGKSTHDTRKLESDHLLSLPVPAVSEDEQHGFVEALRTLRARFAGIEKARATAVAEAERILPALLAEAFGS